MSLDSSKYFCIIIISEAVVVKEKAKPAPEKKGKSYYLSFRSDFTLW